MNADNAKALIGVHRRLSAAKSSFRLLSNGVLVPIRLLVYSPEQMTVAQPVPQIARQDCWPLIPDRIEDLGIQRSIIADLILRYMWLHGAGTLGTLHDSLKLSFPLLEVMFHQFRQQQLL